MHLTFTEQEVVDAARELNSEDFTREDVARQLGAEKADVKQGFNKARKNEQFEKVRNDDENTSHFKLA